MAADARALIEISRRLTRGVARLAFAPPVAHCYNPLVYARAPHELYLRRFGAGPKHVVLVGMNPGPFGMAQTGVPFGDVAMVRGWMGIEAPVRAPSGQHEKRPIQGFGCKRSEVSGSRLWGWARDRFGDPARFFSRFFVLNYCPLVFLEESGRNRTPDKLPRAERERLFACCSEALAASLRVLSPRYVVGVGGFAERRVREVVESGALGDLRPRVGSILHPSPASPLANRGWAEKVDQQLSESGVL